MFGDLGAHPSYRTQFQLYAPIPIPSPIHCPSLNNVPVVSENKSKKAEKTSATTATQTPTVSGDASSESSVGNVVVVTKKSAVVSAESMANGGNMSQKGIGEKVNGESGGGGGMKEKKINLKVLPSPTSHMYCAIIKEASIIMDTVMYLTVSTSLYFVTIE